MEPQLLDNFWPLASGTKKVDRRCSSSSCFHFVSATTAHFFHFASSSCSCSLPASASLFAPNCWQQRVNYRQLGGMILFCPFWIIDRHVPAIICPHSTLMIVCDGCFRRRLRDLNQSFVRVLPRHCLLFSWCCHRQETDFHANLCCVFLSKPTLKKVVV